MKPYRPIRIKKYTKGTVFNHIQKLKILLTRKGKTIHPIIIEYFSEPKFFNALPLILRHNPIKMMKLIEQNSKFNDAIMDPKLYGEIIKTIRQKADGKIIEESGPKINLDHLRSIGINPSNILVFRLTQPSIAAKPELYWTTDFYETRKGLRAEISPEKRKTAIVLISTLGEINSNGGLIRDKNDDAGLSVRQINNKTFNQGKCISDFKAMD
jgi:hypothetical protein